MDLETIYYIGETVAVGAILASLVAIYIQQRQANKIARVENAAALSANYSGSLRDIKNSAELAAIFRKVMFDDEALTPVETTRILLYFDLMLAEHQRDENGLFDKHTFQMMAANTA